MGAPHWSADGSALTYMQLDYMGPDGVKPVGMMRVPVAELEDPKGSPTFGTPKELFPWKYFSTADGKDHSDMTADGKRFLMITTGTQRTATTRFVVVTNWVQELKRLVPTE